MCIRDRQCFGANGVAADVPILVFIGRIAYQKGVHLLLDVLPSLLRACAGRVQLLVCGLADPSDAYAQRCAAQMAYLRRAHPLHFWANPGAYFEDAPLASIAADFGIVPSLYEPSCAHAIDSNRERSQTRRPSPSPLGDLAYLAGGSCARSSSQPARLSSARALVACASAYVRTSD